MDINWDELETQYGGTRKPQAEEGEYKVKLDKVEVKQLTSGSIAVKFEFASEKFSIPWCTHWVSTKNAGWTQWHHKNLLQVLGVNEDTAKAAINKLYNAHSQNPEMLVKGFQLMYDKTAEKHPAVDIVVRPQRDRNGELRYSEKGYQQFESEFKDPRVFMANKPKGQNAVIEMAKAMGAEPADILGDDPF